MSAKAIGAAIAATIAIVVIICLIIVFVRPFGVGPGGFTGLRITTDDAVQWFGNYVMSNNDDRRTALISGIGSKEYSITCTSGYTLNATLYVYGQNVVTAEIWTEGNLRNSKSGSQFSISTVC